MPLRCIAACLPRVISRKMRPLANSRAPCPRATSSSRDSSWISMQRTSPTVAVSPSSGRSWRRSRPRWPEPARPASPRSPACPSRSSRQHRPRLSRALKLAVWALLTLCSAVSPAYAQGRARVVIEVDAAGERLLDARAVRRLVALELSDVDVPEELDGAAPTLFYRVLGDNRGFVDLELWERGTLHGSRRVSSADRAGHLFARRVALAAAELARAVRQQRIAKRRVEARRAARERAERRLKQTRTLEGPLAVRTGVFVARGDALTVFGSNLTLGITLVGATRLDLGARISGAELGDADARWTALEVELG